MTTTHAALTALSALVSEARELAVDAPTGELIDAARGLSRTLDAARTRLVQEGDAYLDAAWAFVEGGRKLIATTRVNIERAKR